jgi:hypothetical protein
MCFGGGGSRGPSAAELEAQRKERERKAAIDAGQPNSEKGKNYNKQVTGDKEYQTLLGKGLLGGANSGLGKDLL